MSVAMHTRYLNGAYTVNERSLCAPGGLPMETGLRQAWETLETGTPLDQRTDPLSRLTLLATEPFFRPGAPLHLVQRDAIGVVFMSRTGSLATDMAHEALLQADRPASPAVFVHTLPNVAIGSLSIRHGLHGAGVCLLNDRPCAEQFRAATGYLAREQGICWVICGWADTFADHAEATFLLLRIKDAEPIDEQHFHGYFHTH